MWNLVLLPRATLFLLLLLRISVGIEAMVSGICVCHSLTVVPTKSSLIFSRKGALRGNTINGLLKCLDTLRSLDRWFCISSQTECAWICTRKSSSLKKGSVVCFFFFFFLVLGMDKVLKQPREWEDWGFFRFHKLPTQQVSCFCFLHELYICLHIVSLIFC